MLIEKYQTVEEHLNMNYIEKDLKSCSHHVVQRDCRFLTFAFRYAASRVLVSLPHCPPVTRVEVILGGVKYFHPESIYRDLQM